MDGRDSREKLQKHTVCVYRVNQRGGGAAESTSGEPEKKMFRAALRKNIAQSKYNIFFIVGKGKKEQ